MTVNRSCRLAAGLLPVGLLAGCTGIQSALSPAGTEASQVSLLLWVMVIFLGLVLVGVVIASVFALFGSERLRSGIAQERFILGFGLAFPVVSLTGLLFLGVSVQAERTGAPGTGDGVSMTVVGEQWWWRVIYEMPDGTRFESANELQIPVDEPVALTLLTADVLHSFWVPSLAGKLDMIPGRENVLTMTATKPGIYRGQCAEYCGGAHAYMAFFVEAMPEAAFEDWLAHAASAAEEPETEQQAMGRRLFMESGCGSCHTIRGTAARGTIGPDLTHVGSRQSIAAARLPNTADAIAAWIVDNKKLKPSNRMPEFDIYSGDELAALAAYLESLE